MVEVDPPQYDQSSSASSSQTLPSVLLEIVPLYDRINFLTGSLGLDESVGFLEGEVQIKSVSSFESREGRTGQGYGEEGTYDKLELCFRGVEKRDDTGEEIELCETTIALWGIGIPSTSQSDLTNRSSNSSSPYPASTYFKLPLTPDIQNCLHLVSSSLNYTLTAVLSDSRSQPIDIVTCAVPVHLSRSSPIDSSHSSPIERSLADPLPISIRLSKSTYRRSETIDLVVRIGVPTMEERERGIRLRMISAELTRIVIVGSHTSGKQKEISGQLDEIEEISTLPSSPQTNTIAKSGKSCRLNSSRPIVIRLRLHPPSPSLCDSVTQVNHPYTTFQI